MERKPEYTLLVEVGAEMLIKDVTDWMQSGWLPCGGVAIRRGANGLNCYAQAMTRGVPLPEAPKASE